MAGTYGSTSTLHTLSTNGSSSGQITLTSFPGQTATVSGWVDIEASYTTLSHLKIDGSNTFYQTERSGTTCPYPVSQGLVIAGHDDVLEHDDYYQSVASLRGNGIGIGWWGQPDNTIIRYNKIHDTGQCDQFDHSIYLAHGNNVQVYGNWIWNNHGGQSFSVYPGATNARLYANVLDGNDSGFDLGDSAPSYVTGDQIYNNVVMNSGTLANKDINWSMAGVFLNCAFGSSNSTGNLVTNNDSYNNPGGTTDGCGSANVTVSNMATANPLFVDPANHNYNLQAGSPVAGYGLWNGS
jgi:hypothetical protein